MKNEYANDITTLIERLGRLLANDAHASGLLPVHWEMLRYLNQANRFSLNSTALTAYLGSTKGTVSQTIKALERKGLVSNKPDAKDRRRNRLCLTAKGKKLLNSDPMKEWEDLATTLPKSIQKSMRTGLKELLSKRLDSRGRQPFGKCQSCTHFASRHLDGHPHFCLLLNEPLSEIDAKSICIEQTA